MKMKLKFHADAYYNGEVVYEAGKVYEVETEGNWASRWIKRGAEIVQDEKALDPIPEKDQNKPVKPATGTPTGKNTGKNKSAKDKTPVETPVEPQNDNSLVEL